MRVVGWVFTDLVAIGQAVEYVRHVDTYFLSAQECITGAYFQNKYPNPCRYSAESYFGSKFVTVVVTGDKNQQVHFEGYQVGPLWQEFSFVYNNKKFCAAKSITQLSCRDLCR